MRKLFLAAIVLAISILFIESLSSYVLYRRFAWFDKSLEPSGSATLKLYAQIFEKRFIRVSADHGPLFTRDAQLGHAMIPGTYRITERNRGRQHYFNLTIDAHGHRATSYRENTAHARLLIMGDSALFGWGVDDESTAAWLLQTRLPDYDVVNLSLTSYSTVHAVLQLEQVVPPIGPDDIVVLMYHPVTNEFNAGSDMILKPMLDGFEAQLGDPSIAGMKFPFGRAGDGGALDIRWLPIACSKTPAASGCAHPDIAHESGMQITMLALDDIITKLQGHRLVFAVVSGTAEDPVIAHARERGMTVVDFRSGEDTGAIDLNVVDGHTGPMWQHFAYQTLLNTLLSKQWVH